MTRTHQLFASIALLAVLFDLTVVIAVFDTAADPAPLFGFLGVQVLAAAPIVGMWLHRRSQTA